MRGDDESGKATDAEHSRRREASRNSILMSRTSTSFEATMFGDDLARCFAG
jgi:hypothetical protein